jgi:bifunctional non-homologous end joining protein LigD
VRSLPAFIEPQFAKSVAKPPSGTGWGREIKLDGYRMLIFRPQRIRDGT